MGGDAHGMDWQTQQCREMERRLRKVEAERHLLQRHNHTLLSEVLRLRKRLERCRDLRDHNHTLLSRVRRLRYRLRQDRCHGHRQETASPLAFTALPVPAPSDPTTPCDPVTPCDPMTGEPNEDIKPGTALFLNNNNNSVRSRGSVCSGAPPGDPHMSTLPLRQPQYARPAFRIATMLQFAINSQSDGRMTLRDIYDWIQDHFPYYRHVATPSWKNQVRANLSALSMFVRDRDGRTGASYWHIHPAANPGLTLEQEYQGVAGRDVHHEDTPPLSLNPVVKLYRIDQCVEAGHCHLQVKIRTAPPAWTVSIKEEPEDHMVTTNSPPLPVCKQEEEEMEVWSPSLEPPDPLLETPHPLLEPPDPLLEPGEVRDHREIFQRAETTQTSLALKSEGNDEGYDEAEPLSASASPSEHGRTSARGRCNGEEEEEEEEEDSDSTMSSISSSDGWPSSPCSETDSSNSTDDSDDWDNGTVPEPGTAGPTGPADPWTQWRRRSRDDPTTTTWSSKLTESGHPSSTTGGSANKKDFNCTVCGSMFYLKKKKRKKTSDATAGGGKVYWKGCAKKTRGYTYRGRGIYVYSL